MYKVGIILTTFLLVSSTIGGGCNQKENPCDEVRSQTGNSTNEAPVCTHVLETYVMTIPDTTAIGTTIGTLDCTDPDHGNVTYQIAITDAVQNIQSLDKNTFSVNSDTGDFKLKQTPTLEYYDFAVIVSDTDGQNTTINVQVFVNDFPPECNVLEGTGTVQDNLDSCYSTMIKCEDPQGGFVNYTSTSELFDLYSNVNGSLDLCPAMDLHNKSGIYEIIIYANNEIGMIALVFTMTILDVNNPPYFDNIRDFNLLEKSPPGTLLGVITAKDPDTLPGYNTLTYTIVEQTVNSTFTLNQDTGVLRLGSTPLNVSDVSMHTLSLMVTDNGGLSGYGTANVTVIDENDPPVCLQSQEILNAQVSRYASVGTIVTSLVCWDYDIEPDYSTIVYTIIDDNEGLVSIDQNGNIMTTNEIPATTESFNVKVRVSDLIMTKTGDFNDSTILDIQISVHVPEKPSIVVSIRMPNEIFDMQLLDSQTEIYQNLSAKVENIVESILNQSSANVLDVTVVSFRNGSVIVDVAIVVNETSSISVVNTTLRDIISTGNLGGIIVDSSYFEAKEGDGYIVITDVSSTGSYHEDNDVKFTCGANVIGNTGTVTVTWKLNDAVINPTAKSRWRTITLQEDPLYPERKEYTLTVNPMKKRDSGILSCLVSDGSLKSEQKINVAVIGKPEVSVSPMTAVVNAGDSATVNCEVKESYSVPVLIVWYRNSIVFTSNQDEIIVGNGNVSTLEVINIKESINYGCKGINVAGEGMVVTSNIIVVDSTGTTVYCPENTDNYGTFWNRTVSDTVVILPCSGNFTGLISRQCIGGNWQTPDYSTCVRQDLQKIFEESDSLIEGILVVDVDTILQNQNVLTSDDQEDLRAGDLEISSSTLINVADYAAERNDAVTVNQLDIFVSSCNNLLEDRNRPEWEQLTRQNLGGVSRLVDAVTTYTKAYTRLNESEFSKTVKRDNLVVQVGKVQSKGVTFPGNSSNLPSWVTESDTQVTFKKASLNASELVGYSSTFYKNISGLFQKYLLSNGVAVSTAGNYEVNSVVVDFSIDPAPVSLNPPLTVVFKHMQTPPFGSLCGFWDFNAPDTPNGAWSTVGSKVVQSTSDDTICEYNHTTNFALLMGLSETPAEHVLALSVISAVGCAISILFLLITIIIYGLLWKYVKSDKSKIMISLCIALLLSYILFLAGVTQTANQDVCTFMAILLHYIFLVDFFMMLAEGVEMAFCVLYVFATRSRARWLIPTAWIFPIFIVGVSMAASQLDGYGNSKFCWLSLESGLIWAFIAPVIVVILANAVILVLVIKAILSSHCMLTITAKEQTKASIRSLCVLLPLLGITWLFGIFSVNEDLVVFQYLFAICNSLQGLFIFLFHCLLSKQIRDGMHHWQSRRNGEYGVSGTTITRQTAITSDTAQPSTSHQESSKAEAGEITEDDASVATKESRRDADYIEKSKNLLRERQADIDKKQKSLADELRAKLGGNSGVATDNIKVTSIKRKDEGPECVSPGNISSSEEKKFNEITEEKTSNNSEWSTETESPGNSTTIDVHVEDTKQTPNQNVDQKERTVSKLYEEACIEKDDVLELEVKVVTSSPLPKRKSDSSSSSNEDEIAVKNSSQTVESKENIEIVSYINTSSDSEEDLKSPPVIVQQPTTEIENSDSFWSLPPTISDGNLVDFPGKLSMNDNENWSKDTNITDLNRSEPGLIYDATEDKTRISDFSTQSAPADLITSADGIADTKLEKILSESSIEDGDSSSSETLDGETQDTNLKASITDSLESLRQIDESKMSESDDNTKERPSSEQSMDIRKITDTDDEEPIDDTTEQAESNNTRQNSAEYDTKL
ncbi:uncharacterized protein LOC134688338 isoform X2 [Mytilus trossulus]|uniref:uncharacterized protein LOC134688338 isoform X2 n=1 Tax=Mytilus trossulus TaxID=6551 RepID=UPI003005E6CE